MLINITTKHLITFRVFRFPTDAEKLLPERYMYPFRGERDSVEGAVLLLTEAQKIHPEHVWFLIGEVQTVSITKESP